MSKIETALDYIRDLTQPDAELIERREEDGYNMYVTLRLSKGYFITGANKSDLKTMVTRFMNMPIVKSIVDSETNALRLEIAELKEEAEHNEPLIVAGRSIHTVASLFRDGRVQGEL